MGTDRGGQSNAGTPAAAVHWRTACWQRQRRAPVGVVSATPGSPPGNHHRCGPIWRVVVVVVAVVVVVRCATTAS